MRSPLLAASSVRNFCTSSNLMHVPWFHGLPCMLCVACRMLHVKHRETFGGVQTLPVLARWRCKLLRLSETISDGCLPCGTGCQRHGRGSEASRGDASCRAEMLCGEGRCPSTAKRHAGRVRFSVRPSAACTLRTFRSIAQASRFCPLPTRQAVPRGQAPAVKGMHNHTFSELWNLTISSREIGLTPFGTRSYSMLPSISRGIPGCQIVWQCVLRLQRVSERIRGCFCGLARLYE